MLFLSSIIGSSVHDSEDTYFGVLEDVLVPYGRDYPEITAIEVKTSKNTSIFVSMSDVELLGKGIVTLRVRKSFLKPYIRKNGDIPVRIRILDKQLVDNEGMKVVRANDIIFGKVKGQFSLLSIDIGFRGLLRRLGLARIPLLSRIQTKTLDFSEISLIDAGSLTIKSHRNQFEKLHPADIANLVEDLSAKRGSNIVSALDDHTAAEVLEEVDEDVKLALIEHLPAEKAADILEDMSPDQAADILDDLSAEKARQLIAKIEPEDGERIMDLISYDDHEAGGLMTSEYLAVFPDSSVGEIRDAIRSSREEIPSLTYVYVVNKESKLLGVVSLRTIMGAQSKMTATGLMTDNVFSLGPHASVRKVARIMTKYNLFSLAITEDDGKMLGIVMVDDIMRELIPDA